MGLGWKRMIVETKEGTGSWGEKWVTRPLVVFRLQKQ